MLTGLAWPTRVAVWDAALATTRAFLRGEGLREVTTGVRVAAPALEPYIEPLRVGAAYLATSPELAMKRLLARGGGPMFQVAHVFRAAEQGALHREEFHLAEWYRPHAPLVQLECDVEQLVARVFEAVGRTPGVGEGNPPPGSWVRLGFIDLMEEETGVALRGDESAFSLRALLSPVSEGLALALRVGDADAHVPVVRDSETSPTDAEAAEALWAWTALFTYFSDAVLPHLLQRYRGRGVHLVDFPAALGALAATRDLGSRKLAARFESHVCGTELANGYEELRDAVEQRRRFRVVQDLRARAGAAPLPLDEAFLAELAGLPPVAGVAVGLDRLLLAACGRTSLAEVTLHFDDS